MKRTLFLAFLLAFASVAFYFKDSWWPLKNEIVSPASNRVHVKDTSLEKYDFENLKKQEFKGSKIVLEKVLKKEENYTSYLFSFRAWGKKVTGQANIPAKAGQMPVIVMVRGYHDTEGYFTGAGTWKAAGVLADNGYITLAPDFLGFGGSDQPSSDILEARFEKPVTILELLASVKTLSQANPEKLGLWAHSNGGQISLSVLEISGKPYPVTFWAPVTIGFPRSITEYMGDESTYEEPQKLIKRRLEAFLTDYDPKKYSIDNYFTDIQSKMQLHQGLADDSVPVSWSDSFVEKMKSLGKEITYYKYPRTDHNLKQEWDLVVQRDLGFFAKNLK